MNTHLAMQWVTQSLFKRGIVRTGKVAGSVVLDLGFDLYWGTETMGWVWTENLGANSEHDQNAVGYRATKARALRKLLGKLDLPRDCVFVDLGSGKGRVLLLAAQMGFQKVIGVEFSPALCDIARANVDKFSRQNTHIITGRMKRALSDIEVIEADVALYMIESDQCIFYAYNPFDAIVMDRFLINLRNSLNRFPRKIWLLYNTPLHADVIEKSDLFSSAEDFEVGGTEIKVYKN